MRHNNNVSVEKCQTGGLLWTKVIEITVSNAPLIPAGIIAITENTAL
jgi:hypothetical protein